MENRLNWIEHVERRFANSMIRGVDEMERSLTARGRGRPKKTI